MIDKNGAYITDNMRTEFTEACSANDVFDILDKELDNCETHLKSLIRERISTASLTKTAEHKYQLFKTCKERLDNIWAFIADDTCDEYFIDKKVTGDISHIYKRCEITLIKRVAYLADTEYKLNETQQTIEDYISVEYLMSLSNTAALEINLPSDTDDDVRELNNMYRIFKCKDCGCVTTELKNIDRNMRLQGLQPRKRCWSCIEKRKQTKLHAHTE